MHVDQADGEVTGFSTEHLRAHRLVPDDVGFLVQLHSDEEAMATVGGVRSVDATAEWLRTNLDHWTENQFGQWRLETLDGEDIGRGGLRWIDGSVGEPLVEVGCVLHRSAWGNGYATEACRAFIDVAASHYDIHELGAITLEGNDASTRVLEKCGFVFERWIDHPNGPHKFLRYRGS